MVSCPIKMPNKHRYSKVSHNHLHIKFIHWHCFLGWMPNQLTFTVRDVVRNTPMSPVWSVGVPGWAAWGDWNGGIICGRPATLCTASVKTLGSLPPWTWNPSRATWVHRAVTPTLAPRRWGAKGDFSKFRPLRDTQAHARYPTYTHPLGAHSKHLDA